jgi:hypothetical protein
VRLRNRTGPVPILSSIRNVVLGTTDGGDYLVADLKFVKRSTRATLTYLESAESAGDARDRWVGRHLTYPLAEFEDQEWRPHGAVSVDGTLWWFDLTWGILSYKAVIADMNQDLVLHELPGDRELHDEPPPHIDTKRSITASRRC